MIMPGIRETATPGAETTFLLTASGVLGERRISDRFAVGQPVQCVIKSRTTDKVEQGYYIPAASNQLTRSRVISGSSGYGVAVDFLTEMVDVRVTLVTGGVDLMLPNISATASVKALFSDHMRDGGDNQVQTLLQNRIYAVPFLQKYAGEIVGLRDEGTAVAGATYRWSIRTVDPATGDPGVELWQSADLTSALAMTSNTVSTGIENNGEPFWLLIMHTHGTNPSFRAGNRTYSGPSHAGFDSVNMRHVQCIWADVTPTGNVIPAAITWGGILAGNSIMPALVYA